jgi:hypothetical protein
LGVSDVDGEGSVGKEMMFEYVIAGSILTWNSPKPRGEINSLARLGKGPPGYLVGT